MGMSYDLFLEPEVHEARKTLPGHIRQRIRRIITELATEPRPPKSRRLVLSEQEVPDGVEIYRLRMEVWRLIYAIHEDEQWVRVLGIYRRPPYDYDNLPNLIDRLL